jgi:hypothetical protein
MTLVGPDGVAMLVIAIDWIAPIWSEVAPSAIWPGPPGGSVTGAGLADGDGAGEAAGDGTADAVGDGIGLGAALGTGLGLALGSGLGLALGLGLGAAAAAGSQAAAIAMTTRATTSDRIRSASILPPVRNGTSAYRPLL